MANYLPLNNEELQLVESIAFMLKQKIEQARLVFVKGKVPGDDIGKEFSYSQAITKLGTFREHEYLQIEFEYVKKFELQNSKDPKYYDEAK